MSASLAIIIGHAACMPVLHRQNEVAGTHCVQEAGCEGVILAAHKAHGQQLLNQEVGIHHQGCSRAGVALAHLHRPQARKSWLFCMCVRQLQPGKYMCTVASDLIACAGQHGSMSPCAGSSLGLADLSHVISSLGLCVSGQAAKSLDSCQTHLGTRQSCSRLFNGELIVALVLGIQAMHHLQACWTSGQEQMHQVSSKHSHAAVLWQQGWTLLYGEG